MPHKQKQQSHPGAGMPHGSSTFFGWYAFAFEHPADWELARVQGGRRAGYVAFDDGERLRIEFDWKSIGRKTAVAELAGRQIAALEKTAKRRGVAFALERPYVAHPPSGEAASAHKRQSHPGAGVPHLRGFEYEAWAWSADVAAVELLARCEGCGRTLLVRVLGAKGNPPDAEARELFGTLACGCGKDFERWGAFGLDVRVPVRFELERSSLKAGLCELVFTDKKVELHILRASLGRMLLEKSKLVAWYESIATALMKPFETSWTKDDVRSHLGYSGAGEDRANRRLMRFFRSGRKFAARVFFCEPSDKIFAVAADGKDDVAAVVREVVDGLVCHPSP